MSDSSGRKPAIGFVFVTLVLLMLSYGIVIPVLPGLVTEFEGGSVSEGSHWYGWLVGSFALMQFIGSPILGALSDRFGRRRVILIALAGSAVDLVVMGLAPTIGWLFFARIVAGVTAGALATCNAYIADVTPPEKRAQGYGLVGAAFGLGFVIGPALGGVFGQISLRLPFFVAAGFVAANWLYGAFVLPESLPVKNRRAFEWKRANPIGALVVLRRVRGLFNLASVYFLFMFASVMLQSIWVLYTGYRYGWSTREVGLSLMFVGAASAIVQGTLVKRIIAWLGERRGLAFGMILSMLVMIGYGSVTKGWMIYVLVVIGGFGGVAGPAAQALIMRHVPPDQYGGVQGALAGLMSLASIFAPMIGAWSFGAFISPHHGWYVPGITFYESAFCMLIALMLAVRSFRADDEAERAAARSQATQAA